MRNEIVVVQQAFGFFRLNMRPSNKKTSQKLLCVVSFVRKTCLDDLQVAFVFPF